MNKNIDVTSSFFNDESDFPKYLEKQSFIKNDDDLKEAIEFIERNNSSIINTFEKYKNYLVYGDVQSGKTNNLIYIAEKVVTKYGYNVVIFLAGTKNDLMFQNQKRFFESFKLMNDEKYSIINSRGKGKRNVEAFKYIFENKRVPIIHSLKRPETLIELSNTLSMIEGEKRILIIDDEGDEASLSPKTMNAIKLFEKFDKTKFISITASPFNNLSNKVVKYDYFHILKSPKTYTSLKDMDSCFSEIKKDKFNAFIRPLIEFAETTTDNNLSKAQILFNVFNDKKSHEEICDLIDDYIKQFMSVSVLEDIKERYSIDFDAKNVSEFYKNIDSRNIIKSNSDNDDVKRMDIEIIVGGFKLSRGITFDNLLSEVMLNMGKSIKASTLVQRARWLGHRGSQVKLIKIYATEEIKEAFSEIRHLIKWTKQYHISTGDFVRRFKASEYKRIKL